MDIVLMGVGAIGSDVAQWGPVVCSAVMWGATGLAMAEGIVLALSGPDSPAFRREVYRVLPWALALAAMQLAVVVAADRIAGISIVAGPASTYFIFALFLPVLWAVGRVRAKRLGMPGVTARWTQGNKSLLMGTMFFMGLGISALVLTLARASPGKAIQDLADLKQSNLSMGILVMWLMINAPWQEELIFRHYLVPRLAGFRGGRSHAALAAAIVSTAAVFALGHGAHLVPAWPKLVQTFTWGLMLGGVRVWLGTGYAIGLHLLLNMAAPLMAPFVSGG